MSDDTHKKARTFDDAWDLQEKYQDIPHGWIQWKGTEVCMDVYCKCGNQFHIDAGFAYSVKCCECGTAYCCNGHIELIELEVEPKDCVSEVIDSYFGDDDDDPRMDEGPQRG